MITRKVDFDEWADDPLDWDQDEELWGADLQDGIYFEEAWEGLSLDDWDQPYDLQGAAAGGRAWRGFLYLSTLVACALLAGFLYLVSFDVSPARASLNPPAAQARAETGLETEDQASPAPEPQAADEALPSADLDCQVSARFPRKIRQWCGLITEQAQKRDLPPDLVAAVILQESGGNPAAFSGSGAVGLMQVMPSDGPAASFMCVNGPCFAGRPSTQELQDPTFNVSYGTKMLSRLVGKHGSLREALKSYGPMDAGYSYADKVLGIYQRYGE